MILLFVFSHPFREILNKQPYGMKIDCWSFGCVLYALVKGHPPFQGSDVAQTLQKVNNPQ
jgi:serine/threonine protein kinase